jgi:hypothetical protein
VAAKKTGSEQRNRSLAVTRPFTIDRALTDRKLLGAGLGPIKPWKTWLIVMRAGFALGLGTDEERELFEHVAGDRPLPRKRVRELWCVIGRRSGKSRMAAALSVFIACFMKHKLAAGEIGFVLVLASSRDQARVVFEYIKGFLEESPVLRQEIESITAWEIRLRNNVVIGTHANSFRSIRGRTLLACIFDEVSLWRDEVSATPDIEVYRAVLPSLLASGGMLIGISTPYRRTGLLYQKHRDYFGTDSDDVLVVQGPSTTFNPTLKQSAVDGSIADDPEGARSEWEATFRSDLAAFLDEATIEAAVDRDRPLELPPRAHQYSAFIDPSGGRHDAFTICIGHEEGESFVADVVRGTKPPFDPQEVVKSYAALLKDYGITEVTGDGYSESWVETAFQDAGIAYERSELKKSQLYLESLPLFTRGAISIPDHQQLLRELRLLERQTHRGGRDTTRSAAVTTLPMSSVAQPRPLSPTPTTLLVPGSTVPRSRRKIPRRARSASPARCHAGSSGCL